METNVTSLDRCGIFQNKQCIQELCPLWSKQDGMCVVDFSGTMLYDMAKKATQLLGVWQSMDKDQKVKAGLSILKKITEGK